MTIRNALYWKILSYFTQTKRGNLAPCVKLVARVEQLENKNAELRRYKAAWDIINIDYSNCPDDYTKPHVLIPLSLWEKAVQIIDKGK